MTLIDCSPQVLDLGRSELGALNEGAFDDPRVSVIVADALEYPLTDKAYDVIVCDFTFPTTKESAQGFTIEWYQKLNMALREGGILAINAVSPQNTASAFACLVATVRAAGFKALPYIDPVVLHSSFRDHGYGAWGFVLAAKQQLTIKQLRSIRCPSRYPPSRPIVACSRGALLSKCRLDFAKAPVNRAARPVLQGLLLNPVAFSGPGLQRKMGRRTFPTWPATS